MSAGAQKSDFTSNLGRIYGIYTGGFVAFVVFIGVLERAGVPNHILGYLFVAFTIGVYAAIGIMSRTMQVDEYYVAGGGLDVGGLLHRHGRHALPARL